MEIIEAIEAVELISCANCKKSKPRDQFSISNRGNLRKHCDACTECKKRYWLEHKAAILENAKVERRVNPEVRQYHADWQRNRKANDPAFRVAALTRSRVRSMLKGNKLNSTVEYLGCDYEDFKIHIEGQFKERDGVVMTWANIGAVWEIDHIVPLMYVSDEQRRAGVIAPTLEEVIQRLDFANCQPLWKDENRRKGNRYIG